MIIYDDEKYREEIEKSIKSNLLVSLYTKKSELSNSDDAAFRSELNGKIEKAWSDLNGGAKFNESELSSGNSFSLPTDTPPGLGVGYLHKRASQDVANELGLNLVRNVSSDYQPQKNDLVLMEVNLIDPAAIIPDLPNPGVTFGGVPKGGEGSEFEVKIKESLVSGLKAMQNTAGGVLVLDWLDRASPALKSMVTSLEKDRVLDGVPVPQTCMVSFLGNLEALGDKLEQDRTIARDYRMPPAYALDVESPALSLPQNVNDSSLLSKIDTLKTKKEVVQKPDSPKLG